MTGIIRLYNKNGLKLTSAIYSSVLDRKIIINTWQESDYTFEEWESFYFHIDPDIVPDAPVVELPKVINKVCKTHKRANFKHVSVPLKNIEMPDFVYDKGMKHETYFHRCYYKNEK